MSLKEKHRLVGYRIEKYFRTPERGGEQSAFGLIITLDPPVQWPGGLLPDARIIGGGYDHERAYGEIFEEWFFLEYIEETLVMMQRDDFFSKTENAFEINFIKMAIDGYFSGKNRKRLRSIVDGLDDMEVIESLITLIEKLLKNEVHDEETKKNIQATIRKAKLDFARWQNLKCLMNSEEE